MPFFTVDYLLPRGKLIPSDYVLIVPTEELPRGLGEASPWDHVSASRTSIVHHYVLAGRPLPDTLDLSFYELLYRGRYIHPFTSTFRSEFFPLVDEYSKVFPQVSSILEDLNPYALDLAWAEWRRRYRH